MPVQRVSRTANKTASPGSYDAWGTARVAPVGPEERGGPARAGTYRPEVGSSGCASVRDRVPVGHHGCGCAPEIDTRELAVAAFQLD
jgi:hypothetical protein